MADKIKTWWSDDRKWFCVLVNDGVSQATVSLTPEEAAALMPALAQSVQVSDLAAMEQFLSGYFRTGEPGEYDAIKAAARDLVAASQPSPAAPVDMALVNELADVAESQFLPTIIAMREALLVARDAIWSGGDTILAITTIDAALAHPGSTARTAPESCPNCINEDDCASVDICRAVEEVNSHNGCSAGTTSDMTSYFDMPWAWFCERRGDEDMRANLADGGLSADDFKQMLDEHEANLIPDQPQAVQVTDDTVHELQSQAFKLSPSDQYRLALFVAENVGYVLVPEPEHPDSPHRNDTESVCHYVENYRFEFDDGRQYTPNEQDKALLEDAIEGYIAGLPQVSSVGMCDALEPFAKIADEYDDREDDSFQLWLDADQPQTRVTLGQCRKARAALALSRPNSRSGE